MYAVIPVHWSFRAIKHLATLVSRFSLVFIQKLPSDVDKHMVLESSPLWCPNWFLLNLLDLTHGSKFQPYSLCRLCGLIHVGVLAFFLSFFLFYLLASMFFPSETLKKTNTDRHAVPLKNKGDIEKILWLCDGLARITITADTSIFALQSGWSNVIQILFVLDNLPLQTRRAHDRIIQIRIIFLFASHGI